MKVCLDCRQDKPLQEFPRASRRKDGRGSYCRECMRARSKASYRVRQGKAGKVVREPVLVPEGYKWCRDCEQAKPLEDFCRNRNEPRGRAQYCKVCHNARSRETRERLYGGGREYHLQRRYGIGQVDVDRMLAAQDGKCAVCGKADPEHVDHDHKTGTVRGLLCFNCNQALGNVRDSLRVLRGLIAYLDPEADRPSGIEGRLSVLVRAAKPLPDMAWAKPRTA